MRFDLHIHSNYSHDSDLAVDDILKQAVKKGLDGIAICDHNTLAGSHLALERAKELDVPLVVIPGMEVSTKKGHLLVLGIREEIPPDLSLQETIRMSRQKGAVVIAAHPFKVRSVGDVDGLDLDAIETFNSRCIFGENRKAREMAQSLGKPEVGGSDSHLLATIGFGYTEIEGQPDESSILQAIREGRTRSKGQIVPLSIYSTQVIRGLFRRLDRFIKNIK